MLLVYLILRTDYVNQKTKDLQQKKAKGSSAWVLLIIAPVFLLIAAQIYFSIQGEELAETMIETAPYSTTIAAVKEVREYKTRNRSGATRLHKEALLQYTVNGFTFYRIIDNKTADFTTGSQLKLNYVIADPYMIKVLP
ncbi:MAG: hypothetical protein ABW174_04960 [Flavitalea sp.]